MHFSLHAKMLQNSINYINAHPSRYSMKARFYRRIISTLALVLILSFAAQALDFTANLDSASRTIKINDTARFTLTIGNNNPSAAKFEIYSPDVQWDVTTEPTKDRLVEIPGERSFTTTVIARPLYVSTGLYVVGLVIKKTGTNERIRKDLEIGITRDQPGEYSPSIRGVLDFSDDIDPKNNATFALDIENQNRRDIGPITIKIRSALINDDIESKLAPLEKKHLEFNYKLDSYTEPQTDTMRITIFTQWRNKTVQFDIAPHKYEVVPYGGVSEKSETDEFLLATTRLLRFTNTGNTIKTKTYKERMSLMQQWFTKATPDPQLKQTDEGTFYIWKAELDPGEEMTITIVENYRPLGYAALLAIVLIVLIYFLRTPVVVRKAAMVVETREGGISELKVLITMRNRSASQIKNVEVTDRVPTIAEVKQDHEVGTMRPSQILAHEHKGTQLKWTIESLDPKEERILSYKIKTKLSVLGGLNLPPCRVGYKHIWHGRITVSNMENLFGGH